MRERLQCLYPGSPPTFLCHLGVHHGAPLQGSPAGASWPEWLQFQGPTRQGCWYPLGCFSGTRKAQCPGSQPLRTLKVPQER